MPGAGRGQLLFCVHRRHADPDRRWQSVVDGDGYAVVGCQQQRDVRDQYCSDQRSPGSVFSGFGDRRPAGSTQPKYDHAGDEYDRAGQCVVPAGGDGKSCRSDWCSSRWLPVKPSRCNHHAIHLVCMERHALCCSAVRRRASRTSRTDRARRPNRCNWSSGSHWSDGRARTAGIGNWSGSRRTNRRNRSRRPCRSGWTTRRPRPDRSPGAARFRRRWLWRSRHATSRYSGKQCQ